MRTREHVRGTGDEFEETELIADRVPVDAETVLDQQVFEPFPLLTIGGARRLSVDPVRALDGPETRMHGPIGEELGFAIGADQRG